MTNTNILKRAATFAGCKLLLVLPVLLFVFFNTNVFGKEKYSPCPALFSHAIFQRFLLQQHGRNDTIPFNITRRDENNVVRYYINGTLFSDDTSATFLLSDSLILNYKSWNVSPTNRVYYSDQGLLISGFLLRQDSTEISLASRDSIIGRPVAISIRNFDIRDLAGLLHKDSSAATGLLNATLEARESDKTLTALSGSVSIRSLSLLQQVLGDLNIGLQMTDATTLHGLVELTGNGNAVMADINYCLGDSGQQFAGLFNIKQLQATALTGFIKSTVQPRSGTFHGTVALNGKLKTPQWKGVLNFDSTGFALNQFGTTYLLDQQKIILDYPHIFFNQFVVKDSLGNDLSATGKISESTAREFDLDLQIASHNFTLISAPKAINNQLYGYTGVDSKVTISGTTTRPLLEGDIQLNNKTDVMLVLPEKNVNQASARSVVRFIDRDSFSLSQREPLRTTTGTSNEFRKFLNYKLNIRTDKQAAVTIVIDPSTGDELRLKGLAGLNAGLDSNQNMVMSGTYQLDSGYYELNYQFLQKRFDIMPGSTIQFNGSTADAQVNIRAVYIANTAAKDLLGNEVGTVSRSIAKSFKQKIPFRVILSLKGSLRQPDISFNIELPENEPISRQLRFTIENKLVQLRADIAATNKQVFALLVMDRFVGEQSTDFFKGNGSDFSDISRESVSKFLSTALDQIASDLFKGINVDLNLSSYKDFSTDAGKVDNDLNIGVSKNFLNDRLTVTVGKNFGIDSRDASTKASQQKASRFLPDVTVNYKLSSDGKYMFRSYKKNPSELFLDGYVVESGLAFIISIDYDLFTELLFGKNKKTSN